MNKYLASSIIKEIDYGYISYGNLHSNDDEGLKLIADALKKQIPKKPTYTDKKNIYGGKFRKCNECGDEVCISPMAIEYENYCRRCGKRLTDWSDENVV